MSESLLTKRLHISGLTPSITPADLERRLSSFGTVKAMDGFGARDALGDPRKFAFVTMEIGAKELAKCLNVLSGSTWKGAKLRIGEAKPDFRERLAQINSQPPRPVRPKRTQARNYGHPSSTLALGPLSAAAAASTPGWTVTPSGRVVRPIRMRPERPLESMRSEYSASKIKGVNSKVKKRIKPPPVRARRRLIDPTKWDSVYLKGVFLDAVAVPLPPSKERSSSEMHDEVDEDETDEDSTDSDSASSSIARKDITPPQRNPELAQDRQSSQEVAPVISSGIGDSAKFIDLRDEANATLAMLDKIFGDKEDWDGRECVDEMEDLKDNNAREKEMQVDEHYEFEIVPRDRWEDSGVTKKDKGKGKGKETEWLEEGTRENGVDVEAVRDDDVEMEETDPSVNIEGSSQSTKPAAPTDLKALFTPREEASFSLLDHLDLDLELDADILGISAPPGPASQENGHMSEPNLPAPHVVQIPTTKSTAKARSRVTLDPSLPLLFPPLDSLPYPQTPSSNLTTTNQWHGTSTCFLFPLATRVRGLHPLPPSITFTRSLQDTPESVRETWEQDKSSLTHEWKKAWREARGSRRGRTGAAGDVG